MVDWTVTINGSAILQALLVASIIGAAGLLLKRLAGLDRTIAEHRTELADAIAASCRHKAAIVARDEFEQGERALLNFGHTFGHALEAADGYAGLLHGEAVAIGMVLAARLSAALGRAPQADAERAATAALARQRPAHYHPLFSRRPTQDRFHP